jgi:hypothetical protein
MSTAILQALIKPNAQQLFADDCETLHRVWKELLEKTTLPDNTTSTDDRVLERIRELDNRIRYSEDRVVSRLAYIQLTRMLAALRKKIQDDRRHGLLVGERSQRDATVAIDIYLRATGKANRGEVSKFTSLGNRWTALAGRYPLLLVTFTNVAERIVYVRSYQFSTFLYHLHLKARKVVCQTRGSKPLPKRFLASVPLP